jgi:pilus assembly protein CpaE
MTIQTCVRSRLYAAGVRNPNNSSLDSRVKDQFNGKTNMKLPVVLIGEDNIALVSLCHQLEKEMDFLVESRVHGFKDAFEFLRTKTGPILVFVDLSRDPEKAFQLGHEIKLKLPNLHLLMTSSDSSPENILRAMRSGAEDFFKQPFNWIEVLHSLEGMRRRINLQSAKSTEQGKIIAVFSNKGGAGSTTAATNLAVALVTQRGKSVCIVDLVLQFGCVTSFLNLEASYSIVDLVKNLKGIDTLLLDGSLIKHASGLRVLPAPFHSEDGKTIEPAEIEQILDALVRSFDLVIVDTPSRYDEAVLNVLDRAHLVLFVTEMNVLSLKNSHRALELFDRIGIHREKIRLVLNRYIKSKSMDLESVEKTLGIKVFWTLPNDYPTALAALNQGLSIQETDAKCELAKSYQALADAVMGDFSFPSSQKPDEERKKFSMLRRWMAIGTSKERELL